MNITVDLSEYTGNWDQFKDRIKKLPNELMKEMAITGEHIMKEKCPVDKGYLMNSIIYEKRNQKYQFGPHVEYAYKVRFYGRRSIKYGKTYSERTKDELDRHGDRIVKARAKEFLEAP